MNIQINSTPTHISIFNILYCKHFSFKKGVITVMLVVVVIAVAIYFYKFMLFLRCKIPSAYYPPPPFSLIASTHKYSSHGMAYVGAICNLFQIIGIICKFQLKPVHSSYFILNIFPQIVMSTFSSLFFSPQVPSSFPVSL